MGSLDFYPQTYTLVIYKVVQIGGAYALQDKVSGSVTIKQNGLIYYVDNGVGRKDIELVDSTTFDQVLATFKFIES